jgi:hypothetical protein
MKTAVYPSHCFCSGHFNDIWRVVIPCFRAFDSDHEIVCEIRKGHRSQGESHSYSEVPQDVSNIPYLSEINVLFRSYTTKEREDRDRGGAVDDDEGSER